MRLALRLARRGHGRTSPNPMVGAVIVRAGKVMGTGWHRRAGLPHAEVEALEAVRRAGEDPRDATLYVTLEPCSTQGRTPPCTAAIVESGIRRVVAAATDPNPSHAGRGFELLRQAGVQVETGVLAGEADRLNEAFNHWVVERRPFVTVKVAMTLDGRIATRTGESKWITGPAARQVAMRWRAGADAVLVGVGTVLADDPALTVRRGGEPVSAKRQPLRIVLDSRARTPVTSRLLTDGMAGRTLIVVTDRAPRDRVRALTGRVEVLTAPVEGTGADPARSRIDLEWLLDHLGGRPVVNLLVEGGGTVHGALLDRGLVQRFLGFYAPLMVSGERAPRALGGEGAGGWEGIRQLAQVESRRVEPDWLLTGRVVRAEPAR